MLDEVLQVTAPMFDDLVGGALPLSRNALQTLTRRLARRRRDLEGVSGTMRPPRPVG